MSSGYNELKKFSFKSPVTGGDRQLSVAVGWTSGVGYENVCPLWIHAYNDEIPEKIINEVNSFIKDYAEKTGIKEVSLLTEGDGKSLSDVKARAKKEFVRLRTNTKFGVGMSDDELFHHAVFACTGFRPMTDRLPKFEGV